MTEDKLLDRFMNDRMRSNKVSAHAEAVMQTSVRGAVDSVLTYVERYNNPAAIPAVVQVQHPGFGPWLKRHADVPDLVDWSDIGRMLSRNGWRDKVVAQVLMNQMLTKQNPRTRASVARSFVGMGTLEEVRIIAVIGDTTSSKWMRWTATATQARFDVPEFNEHLRSVLSDTSRLSLRILEGLELNHRHDFLPELRGLRAQFEQSDPRDFLVYIEDLITELEAKRAEGVKPGAPIDYPNNTRSDSTSTR